MTPPNKQPATRRVGAALFLLLAATAAPAAHARPGPAPSVASPARRVGASATGDCLCIFDADRTLTGLQDTGESPGGNNVCPADYTYLNSPATIEDPAYGGGHLTLSDLGRNMASTWCGRRCYLGIITAEPVTSSNPSAKHRKLAEKLSKDRGNVMMPSASAMPWHSAKGTQPAPLLHSANPDHKYQYVHLIVEFFKQTSGVTIHSKDVYFFDDIESNVRAFKNKSFEGKLYNAFQISCGSRDQKLGKCGGTVAEVAHRDGSPGCRLCNHSDC